MRFRIGVHRHKERQIPVFLAHSPNRTHQHHRLEELHLGQLGVPMNVRRGDDQSLSRYNSARIAAQTLAMAENPDQRRFVLAQIVRFLFELAWRRDFDVLDDLRALLQRFVGFEDVVELIAQLPDQVFRQFVVFFHQFVVRHLEAALARVGVAVNDAEPVSPRRAASVEEFVAAESELRSPELRELVDFLETGEVGMHFHEFGEG